MSSHGRCCIRSSLLNLALLVIAFTSTIVGALPCRLDLAFDAKPHEVAWELRGPLPGVKLLAQAGYDTYNVETFAGKTVSEAFDLQEGNSYYLLITDYSQDGMTGGSFKLSASLPRGDIILKQGPGETIGAGRAFNFVVPAVPDHMKIATPR